MKILYIDTSSSYLYCGIVCDDKLISEVKEDLGQNLSRDAMPKIASMFEKSNMVPSDINKIIVVNGPGSFTGIRVGLTIAKVYAWSLNIPITTITSLEAMKESCSFDDYIVSVIDARRDYSYAAIYNKDEIILNPQHISNESLTSILNKLDNYIIVTNDNINLNGKKCSYDPDILSIVKKYVEKENINPHYVNPEYLKLTEAEEKKEKEND